MTNIQILEEKNHISSKSPPKKGRINYIRDGGKLKFLSRILNSANCNAWMKVNILEFEGVAWLNLDGKSF